ncbi:MAG: 4-(cytidine 5'-diphospho)-2-C-methyl-D-erythritol kinase [Oscillospiraceae bacterium]|nr:4-(cytidine 5'-diphospho)-2-C-methyl-D-erythritol kinase [Oscillospiraceae bacterium]
MSRRLTLQCAAKLNLSLDVTGKREDGYHTLESIFQSVNVYDTIELTAEEGDGISLSCETQGVPCDERNLAWKAAQAILDESGKQAKISIFLKKAIPSGAGMGGGSSDAAGVLWGLNRMLECGFSDEKLREIGVKLGADVPFILLGGMALVEGIGEILRPMTPLHDQVKLVIVKGTDSVSTPEAYKAIDALEGPVHPDTAGAVWAVETQDTGLLAEKCANLFEAVTNCRDVNRAKRRLMDMGAMCAVMTGSGAAVFGIFPDVLPESELECVARTLRQEFAFAQAAHPTAESFRILEEI